MGSVELHLSELAQVSDAIDYPYTSTGKKVAADPIRLDKGNAFKGQLHYEAEFIPALALQGVEFASGDNKMQQAAGNGGSDGSSFVADDGSSVSSSDVEMQSVPAGITTTAPVGAKYTRDAKSTDTGRTVPTIDTDVGTNNTSPNSPVTPSSLISPAHGNGNGNGNGTEEKEVKGVAMSKEELMKQRMFSLLWFSIQF